MDSIDIVFKKKTKTNRLAVIKNETKMIRLLLISEKKKFLENDVSFQTMLSSIKKLKESELLQPKRKVIKIYTVKPTDTFEKIISKQKIQKRFSKEVFMILNEKKTADLKVGEKIKIIDSQS